MKNGTNLLKPKKTVHDYIEPLKPCMCGENVFITIAVEPINADYFKDDSVQHCIVQCKRCGKCTYQNINMPAISGYFSLFKNAIRYIFCNIISGFKAIL